MLHTLQAMVVQGTLDRTGVFVSTACAVHCALMPLLAGMLPLIGLDDRLPEAVEPVALVASVALAAVSLTGGCLHSRQWQPWLYLGAGVGAIAFGRFAVEDVAWLETVSVVTGALLLATAHLVNRRLCCTPACC